MEQQMEKHPVALTNNNTENMSRMQMLEWVNTTTNVKYEKIEHLYNGVAYCQMMEQIYPNSVGLKKIKMNPKLDHEFMHNLRLLQMAFIKMNIDKTVPMERLLKGRFQDNLEFLQWFIKFYNTNKKCSGHSEEIEKTAGVTKNPSREMLKPHGSGKENDSPNMQAIFDEKLEVKSNLQAQIQLTLNERDFFYKKIEVIEKLVRNATDNGDEDSKISDWRQRCLNIIYDLNSES